MLATPGCCARDDIGATFAGVFCGVLVDNSMLAEPMMAFGVFSSRKTGLTRRSVDVRSGYGVELLISDGFRHGDLGFENFDGKTSGMLVRKRLIPSVRGLQELLGRLRVALIAPLCHSLGLNPLPL